MLKKIFAAGLSLAVVTPGWAVEAAGEGTVNAIMAKERKLSITYGPIKAFEMQGMTMDFPVADPAILVDVKPGVRIRFTLSKERDGSLLITDLEVLSGAAAKPLKAK